MFAATLVSALTIRIVLGDWQITDPLVPLAMIALIPFLEWIIHVFILHWRPRHLGAFTIDPLLAASTASTTSTPLRAAPLHPVEGTAVGTACRSCDCGPGLSTTQARADLFGRPPPFSAWDTGATT
jgi:hypothetical protein